MENNQNEKVSITFEVEKDFIKAVMQISGFSTKDAEEAMIAIGMAFKKITAKEMQSKPSGLFAKLQSLKEESKRLGKEEWK